MTSAISQQNFTHSSVINVNASGKKKKKIQSRKVQRRLLNSPTEKTFTHPTVSPTPAVPQGPWAGYPPVRGEEERNIF